MRVGRFLALAVIGAGLLHECRSRPEARSLVLIVVDTLRRDHLAAYGYGRETAPRLSRLAAEGAALEGVSPASWTKPATAALLTGLHPLRHQAIGGEDALPSEALTLAERLRGRGYRTLCASANISISPGFGFDQGCDVFLLGSQVGFGVGPGAEALNRELEPRLAALRPPFFLYVHYVDPHTPYEPRSTWQGAPLGRELRSRGALAARELSSVEFAARPAGMLRDAVDLYDGEIRGADEGIAQLLDRLQGLGLMRNALTVVTADHGEEFEEHGRMEHGKTLYEEVVQVPLIVHAPGLVQPGLHGGPASLLDVVPTVLDLLGLPPGEGLDGVGLAEWLRGRAPSPEKDRELLLHLDDWEATSLALEAGKDKLVLARSPYRKQLFDLGGDPREQHARSLDPDAARRFAELAGRLAGAYNALVARALPRTLATPAPEVDVALRGLGYVSRGDSRRVLPPVIAPAPAAAVGPLGWEPPFEPCVRPADPAAVPQLLEGWWPVELGGRWTRPEARAALAVPEKAGALTLALSGENFDRRPARVRILLDGALVLERTVAPGPCELSARVARPTRNPAPVEIERRPPFVPSAVGLADSRPLGLFIRSLCLQ
jgi:arylsulfatase